MLPTVTRFSLGGVRERYATLAEEMGVASRGSSDEEASALLVEGLEALNRNLEIPRLRDLGIERDHFEAVLEPMSRAALESGSPGFNPRQPSAEEIVAIYRAVY
ncbi:MAG: iron-containing alcohol dehydrogenase [Rubrobacter sp.]|nr:iron-containing alcohol dehydrogenase [Rubrobacter sp.]